MYHLAHPTYLGVPDVYLPYKTLFFNVKDYGAVGDGVTNDKVAIQAAYDAAKAAGGGIVFYPAGKYQIVVGVGIGQLTFSGESQGSILSMGCGRSSHIVMAGDGGGGDKWLFDIKDGCKKKSFKSLMFSSELINEHEQQHLINYSNSSGSVDLKTGQACVVDCYFGHAKGDAIRFLGNNTKRVKDILTKRCIFEMFSDPGAHARSAISWQRSSDDITVDACYMTDDSTAIEYEPTGTGSNESCRVHRNHCIGQVTPSGNGAGFEHTKSNFSCNTIDGLVFGLDVENMVFSDSIVDMTVVDALGVGAFALIERIHNVTVADNILYRSGDTHTSPPSTVGIDGHSVGDNYRINFDGNIVGQENNLPGGFAFSFREFKQLRASDNLCIVKVNTVNEGGYFRCEAVTETVNDVLIEGNLGICTGSNVKRGVTSGIGNNSIQDNLFQNVQAGVELGGVKAEQYLVARNIFIATNNAITMTGGTPPSYCCVDGAGDKGPSIYLLTAAPEGTATAVQGTIGLRSTGGGAGTTLYVKTSGTGSAGWTAK